MLQTSRFGEIEVAEDQSLCVVGGLLGFGGLTRYALYQPEALGIFRWLQSEEVPELAFVVCDPRVIVPSYHIEVPRQELACIGLEDPAKAEIMAILTYPQDPRHMTANLMGPVVLNRSTRLARQVVVTDTKYTTRHCVFPRLRPEDETAAETRAKARNGDAA